MVWLFIRHCFECMALGNDWHGVYQTEWERLRAKQGKPVAWWEVIVMGILPIILAASFVAILIAICF